MKKTILALIFSIFILESKMIEIIDVVGNKYTINVPAKKIAIGLYYTELLAVGGNKAFDNVIGFSKFAWSEWSTNSWNMYIKAMPSLDKIDDFGTGENISVEKILSLNPDILILPKFYFDSLKEVLKPIQQANIPIVIIDYHSGNFHKLSTEILGKITDNQDRAKQIINEYESRLNYIKERTKNIKTKAKVYVEQGYDGAKEQGNTYSHFMWGDLIDKAGAKNIADGLVTNYGIINPEIILTKNPDLIIIAGKEFETKKGETMIMGNGVPFNDANKRLKSFLNRDGWDDIDAIKNKKLFGGYHGMIRNISDIFMIEYIAKAAYPEIFKDLNPKKNYLEFNKKYLPVIPDGTFMLKLDDEQF